MLSHVQEVQLAPGSDHTRLPVDWPALGDAGQWKVFSLARNKPTWIEPLVTPSLASHPFLASSLLLLKSPDWQTTLCIYPVGALFVLHDLIVDPNTHKVYANLRRVSGDGEDGGFVVCVKAEGPAEERRVVEFAVQKGRELLGGKATGREGMREEWHGLGVCTWESFRKGNERLRPTKSLLLSLLPSLPISHYLIDDGWQDIAVSSVGRKRLRSFAAWDGMGAPMREVVSALKVGGAGRVGVWLTLQGYWFGIDPAGPLAERYACEAYEVAARGQPRGGVRVPLEGRGEEDREEMWFPRMDRVGAFWRDWFEELKSWGVDFVKVDNQGAYDTITGPGSLAIQQAMWSGMLAAAEAVWGSAADSVIMCMSHTERMLNGPGGLDMDRPTGSLVFRNSDDFALGYPNAHADFIWWNLGLSILTSHLSLTPDFDMFASSPSTSSPTYHVLLRALTPGPTFLSDTPDHPTDLAVLGRLMSKDSKGRSVVVKTGEPVRLLSGRYFWDNVVRGEGDGPGLMGGVRVEGSGGGMIGVWHTRDLERGGQVVDRVVRRDVEDLLGCGEAGLQGEWILWSGGHAGGGARRFAVIGGEAQQGGDGDGKEGLDIVLQRGECECVIVSPVLRVSSVKCAVLGMLEKYASLAGVSVQVDGDKLVIHSRYKATIWVAVFGTAEFQLSAPNAETKRLATEALAGEDRWQVVQVPFGDWEALRGDDDFTARLTFP